ncbi:SDR family oxidoreductase [Jannaschia aquimarina]|uniref:YcdF protein n=1 Tax=Jannaschia aquimarina TaxID=935700 RepID=A0A0D1D315_9RHOB|nr:SDR family oxidoreductase [Jannaschia aquimarina]KIT14503.1 Glucose 1-dehydrogenase 2 [Jannaschia aquimarina]SNT28455.1 NAD(P)-dependent dehydrogenase, short-chain alcohol dehydrogenase family [Jannaschia aquimarina]
MEIRTRTALVTGAAGLIGRGLVTHLLGRGWRVAALDEAPDVDGPGAPAGGDLLRLVADVSDEAAVRRSAREVADWAGRLDLLVNNAGLAGAASGPVEHLSLEDWNRRLAVNLTGPLLMAKHFAPLLREARGAIVNITSTRAHMSEPDCESYAASKGGLTALTHALAISLGPEIRVNAVAPGWITEDDLRGIDHAQHPAGRAGRPEDVAETATWLADAGFVTGQVVIVDGGMTRKMIYAE